MHSFKRLPLSSLYTTDKMCDIGNLIDLTGWDEPVKDETVVEEPPIQSNSFKGPYDPFDLVEKEACIKVCMHAHSHIHRNLKQDDKPFFLLYLLNRENTLRMISKISQLHQLRTSTLTMSLRH